MIYLLHFDTPYKHAGHYLGYCDNLEERMARHLNGNGARLMEVITKANISFKLSRVWDGDRTLERKLHNQNNSPRLCPICRAIKERKEDQDETS